MLIYIVGPYITQCYLSVCLGLADALFASDVLALGAVAFTIIIVYMYGIFRKIISISVNVSLSHLFTCLFVHLICLFDHLFVQ